MPLPSDGSAIDPQTRAAVVAFLRHWLPEEAKRAYRAMIARDPQDWNRDPHFQGGIIIEHVLRGNGIDERLLGGVDLEVAWPELLKSALEEG